ncbi:MAG: beta-ketoacyl synthase N-terminal-like domain-containing protein [Marinibacterium profundimaris]
MTTDLSRRSNVSGAEPLAVLGMALRLPGAPDEEALWQVLTAGLPVSGAPPEDRWALREAERPVRAGFLPDIFDFDCELFSVSPREAALLDPQLRLFLELAWLACDDAGRGGAGIAGSRCGVYVGCSRADYFEAMAPHLDQGDYFAGLGNSKAAIANRLSTALDLRGPSVCMDTLCSSSFSALHAAAVALRSGQAEMALVGGVNFLMSPRYLYVLQRFDLLSSSGRAHPFDAAAGGFFPGEGGVVLLLKPLSKALEDGDRIRAVLRGIGLEHQGAGAGLNAPDAGAIAGVMRSALDQAGLDGPAVDTLHCMGSASAMGDAAELEAISLAYGLDDRPGAPLAATCEKGSIGHLEPASGLAALATAILGLERGRRFPLAGLRQPRHAPPCGLRFVTGDEAAAPATPDAPRRVGVTSLGMSGTHGHAILEAAPERGGAADDAPCTAPLVLSARTAEDLRQLAAAYAGALRDDHVSLNDICFTAATGRWHGSWRAVVRGSDRAALTEGLRRLAEGIDEPVRSRAESLRKGATPAPFSEAEGPPDLAAAQRFLSGQPVPWSAVFGPGARRVALPPTPLRRDTHRFAPPRDGTAPAAASSAPLHPAARAKPSTHPLLRRNPS